MKALLINVIITNKNRKQIESDLGGFITNFTNKYTSRNYFDAIELKMGRVTRAVILVVIVVAFGHFAVGRRVS